MHTLTREDQGQFEIRDFKFNDPTAGSPTVTLLRLLLPLDESVRTTLTTHSLGSEELNESPSPKSSPAHPIGSSDGRCVQRAGT
jgi:hypothetical protein